MSLLNVMHLRLTTRIVFYFGSVVMTFASFNQSSLFAQDASYYRSATSQDDRLETEADEMELNGNESSSSESSKTEAEETAPQLEFEKPSESLITILPSDQFLTARQLLDTTPKIRTPDVGSTSGNSIERLSIERRIRPKVVKWESDRFTHQKLLFEEHENERYYTAENHNRQSFRSGVRFFSQGMLFPIQMAFGKQKGCESTKPFVRD